MRLVLITLSLAALGCEKKDDRAAEKKDDRAAECRKSVDELMPQFQRMARDAKSGKELAAELAANWLDMCLIDPDTFR